MQQPAVFYQHQVDQYTSELRRIRKKLLSISLLRLASFLILAGCLYWTIADNHFVASVLLPFSIILFILLVRSFSGTRDRRNFTERLLYINTNELDVISGKKNAFADGSSVTDRSIFADDLDIYGPGSLFHYINRTTTIHGEQALSRVFNRPLLDKNEIISQQAAVRQLSVQPGACQHITARGLLKENTGTEIGQIERWIKDSPRVLELKWLKPLRYILPVLNTGGLLYYLDSGNPVPLGVGIIIAWIITGYFGRYTMSQHLAIGRKHAVLEKYSAILRQFLEIDAGTSSILSHVRDKATLGNVAVKRLSALSSLFDQRLNLLVNVILNSLIMYDIQCLFSLEKWKVKYRQDFRMWIDTVGEIEKLVTFGIYAFNHPSFSYPETVEGRPYISATALAHPLINPGESVPNDVVAGADEKLILVTGSNMSGKSTFLRTVGVNLLMAQCGVPVCAREFRFTPMSILSSIRISDSLQEHTSYFMAELKKLKSVMDALETGAPALVLIDEVLRGTNSNDKTHGSESLIKRLAVYNCLTLFATHDLLLSTLESELPGVVSNYCFESIISDEELMFDYKLNRGVAKNKNATFLMHKMGILS